MSTPSPKSITAQNLAQEILPEFPNLSSGQIQDLATYLHELMLWNRKTNLVGKRDWRLAYHDLIKDSLYLAACLQELDLPQKPLSLDLGAGAGIPGIPLRILWGKGRYLLVEPRQKRALFLHHILRHIPLAQSEVHCCQAQDLCEPPADLVLSRALCPWPEFLSLASPLLAPSGLILTFSKHSWEQEDGLCPSGFDLVQERAYPGQDKTWRYFWFFVSKK